MGFCTSYLKSDNTTALFSKKIQPSHSKRPLLEGFVATDGQFQCLGIITYLGISVLGFAV